jgi:hypothetical protein
VVQVEDLGTVQLLGVPLSLHARYQSYVDALLREFDLLRLRSTRDATPVRVLALAERVRSRYDEFTDEQRRTLEAAIARGDDEIDLTFRLPKQAAPVCDEIIDALDEADAYCRTGSLLTLAPTAEVVAYRQWGFGEIARQLRGATPTPWRDHETSSATTGSGPGRET